ncbi:hypothetical protein LWI28_013893 [Acer negundo]|uniref:Myb/SANT-like domain-containing protein n=1 Tax=Acer negundo TaxID=4023 RepID=A0AAD5J4V2_ACENE|nr:hypothetical protein LWI28_013893 [Acer negundo]
MENINKTTNSIENKNKGPSGKAIWDTDSVALYFDLCIVEIEVGRRPGIHFTKLGWDNLIVNFNKATGREYSKLQLKNKWDALKNDWKLWKQLIGKETGLGWNAQFKTIDAPDDWTRLEPPITSNYFGNCVVAQVSFLKAEDLMKEKAVEIAAKKLSEAIKGLENKGDVEALEKLFCLYGKAEGGIQILGTAGSNRFGVYVTDFGWVGLKRWRLCPLIGLVLFLWLRVDVDMVVFRSGLFWTRMKWTLLLLSSINASKVFNKTTLVKLSEFLLGFRH